jgi:membrane protein required for colicin V production
MELIDIILGGILLYGLINGYRKGLFVELASLVSLVLGIYLAIKFSGYVGKMFDSQLPDNPKHAAIIAFILTFIAVVVCIMLLAKVFTKIADFTGLGLPNRLLGALFGCIRIILILSVALNFFVKINSNNTFAKKETLEKSIFFYPVLSVSKLIFPVLEEWFAEYKAGV